MSCLSDSYTLLRDRGYVSFLPSEKQIETLFKQTNDFSLEASKDIAMISTLFKCLWSSSANGASILATVALLYVHVQENSELKMSEINSKKQSFNLNQR